MAEDEDREATRYGVDKVWHSLAIHRPTLPVPPVKRTVPAVEAILRAMRYRAVEPVSLVNFRLKAPVYIACSGSIRSPALTNQ